MKNQALKNIYIYILIDDFFFFPLRMAETDGCQKSLIFYYYLCSCLIVLNIVQYLSFHKSATLKELLQYFLIY